MRQKLRTDAQRYPVDNPQSALTNPHNPLLRQLAYGSSNLCLLLTTCLLSPCSLTVQTPWLHIFTRPVWNRPCVTGPIRVTHEFRGPSFVPTASTNPFPTSPCCPSPLPLPCTRSGIPQMGTRPTYISQCCLLQQHATKKVFEAVKAVTVTQPMQTGTKEALGKPKVSPHTAHRPCH